MVSPQKLSARVIGVARDDLPAADKECVRYNAGNNFLFFYLHDEKVVMNLNEMFARKKRHYAEFDKIRATRSSNLCMAAFSLHSTRTACIPSNSAAKILIVRYNR